MPTFTIDLNSKYYYVIEDDDFPDGDPADELKLAAQAYSLATDIEPTEAHVVDPTDTSCLTWQDISPPKDPDLLKRMATYFDGIDPMEDSALIRAKLRLLDVEHVVNAQTAARAERDAYV